MIERNFEMNLIVEYKIYSDLEPKINFISDFNNQITIKIDENSIIKFLCYQKIIYKENGEYKKIATDGENPEKIRESQLEQGFVDSFKNEFLFGEKYNKGTYYNEEGEILINVNNLFKNKIEENKICPVVSQETGLVQYIKMNESLNGKLPCDFFFENNLKEKQKEENKKNNCCDEKTNVTNTLNKVNSNKENNNNCSITNNNNDNDNDNNNDNNNDNDNDNDNDNIILLENTAKKKDLIDENYIEILDDNINESFHSSNKKRVKEDKKKNNNNKNNKNNMKNRKKEMKGKKRKRTESFENKNISIILDEENEDEVYLNSEIDSNINIIEENKHNGNNNNKSKNSQKNQKIPLSKNNKRNKRKNNNKKKKKDYNTKRKKEQYPRKRKIQKDFECIHIKDEEEEEEEEEEEKEYATLKSNLINFNKKNKIRKNKIYNEIILDDYKPYIKNLYDSF